MIVNILLACVLTAAGGYLLGSILFGVLISKVMYNDDVRNHGSGNAGMTNVLRTYGKLPAVFTTCLLYTSPSPRDRTRSRMPSSA